MAVEIRELNIKVKVSGNNPHYSPSIDTDAIKQEVTMYCKGLIEELIERKNER